MYKCGNQYHKYCGGRLAAKKDSYLFVLFICLPSLLRL